MDFPFLIDSKGKPEMSPDGRLPFLMFDDHSFSFNQLASLATCVEMGLKRQNPEDTYKGASENKLLSKLCGNQQSFLCKVDSQGDDEGAVCNSVVTRRQFDSDDIEFQSIYEEAFDESGSCEILNLLEIVIHPALELAIFGVYHGETSGPYFDAYPWPINRVKRFFKRKSVIDAIDNFERCEQDALNAVCKLSSLLRDKVYFVSERFTWLDARSFGIFSVCLNFLSPEHPLRVMLENCTVLVSYTQRLNLILYDRIGVQVDGHSNIFVANFRS